MAKVDWINRHRGIVFLLIGVGILGFFLPKAYDLVIEEKDTRIESLQQELTTVKKTLEIVRNYANKLEKKEQTYRLVKPDGTIIERTSSDTTSETEISESVKSQYEQRITKEIQSLRHEMSKTTSERKKLNLGGGITLNQQYWLGASYSVWGPITINGNMVLGGPYLIGIGIDL